MLAVRRPERVMGLSDAEILLLRELLAKMPKIMVGCPVARRLLDDED